MARSCLPLQSYRSLIFYPQDRVACIDAEQRLFSEYLPSKEHFTILFLLLLLWIYLSCIMCLRFYTLSNKY